MNHYTLLFDVQRLGQVGELGHSKPGVELAKNFQPQLPNLIQFIGHHLLNNKFLIK